MKNRFIVGIIFISMIFISNIVSAQNNFEGRWAEKISERVVMDIYQDRNDNEYFIFITCNNYRLFYPFTEFNYKWYKYG